MNEKAVSQKTLELLLQQAEQAYGEGGRREDWAAWYAAYIWERLPQSPWLDFSDDPEELPSSEPYLNE